MLKTLLPKWGIVVSEGGRLILLNPTSREKQTHGPQNVPLLHCALGVKDEALPVQMSSVSFSMMF